MSVIHKKHLSSFQIIIFGFVGTILLGAFLLMFPFATRANGYVGFGDALFTATSAVYVIGLVLHDTASYWSEFGQFIIMLLIQIGGLAMVTVAAAVAMVSGRNITNKTDLHIKPLSKDITFQKNVWEKANLSFMLDNFASCIKNNSKLPN